MKRTPFHERTAALNEGTLWEHWVGYLAATRYSHSSTVEYYAVRNTVGVFDASPLFKYRIAGPDSSRLLSYVLTRDIGRCAIGRCQYTIWCNDEGYVMEDGIVLRVAEDEYLMTTARPNLRYFGDHALTMDANVTDITEEYGLLAVQGPSAHMVLNKLTTDPLDLEYFGVKHARMVGTDVVISRTGFTGDLGYEIWAPVADALTVWDALFAAGQARHIAPIGLQALDIARIDAGLLQIDVDFDPARFAWSAAQRETPSELGFDWMLESVVGSDRAFVGRDAIVRELETGTTRWRTVGIELGFDAYDNLYTKRGLMPPKEGVLVEGSLSLYSADLDNDPNGSYLGYATSLSYSPILKRHVAIGKLPLGSAGVGSEVFVEITVTHRPRYVAARVVPMPFFEPARKLADPAGASS